jgi:hypothetical protein
MQRPFEFRRSQQPSRSVDDDSLIITRATIRLMLWRDVPVRTAASLGLTPLEQFVLEAVIALRTFTRDQFTQITGLPADLLDTLARRLVNTGAVTRDDSGYRSVPETAEAALARSAVVSERTRQANFIYLPGTDDLVAIEPAGARALHDALSRATFRIGSAPVPRSLINRNRQKFVAEHMRRGTIRDLQADVIGVVEDADLDVLVAPSGTCFAYRCTAIVSRPDASITITLLPATEGDDGGRHPDTKFHIKSGSNVATQWLSLADLPARIGTRLQFWQALAGNAPQPAAAPARTSASRWQYGISGLIAEALTESPWNLSFDTAVDVATYDAAAEVIVSFSAADPYARRLIAMDAAIAEAHKSQNDPEPLVQLIRNTMHTEPGRPSTVTFEAVLARVWKLGHYRLAYAFTEHRDFAYA